MRVPFYTIAPSYLQMSRNNSALLIVPGGISGQLENFRREVFQHRGQINGGSRANSLGVVSLGKMEVVIKTMAIQLFCGHKG